ncbi:DddA-like double-stranded DNA deaminase toxin [Kitasatospora sp. NPDC091207]|uniref:DddA-like double-stranded DNA deaminase toxin n=1 Tax=Kitasatospora sp. NPDC091207 TaxID=3364083 RepID=UPI0037F51A8E
MSLPEYQPSDRGLPIGPEFISEYDSKYTPRIDSLLRTASGREKGGWWSSTHAEPKIELWMNDNGIDFANVVINQDHVCRGPAGEGCSNILPCILEKGRQWSSGMETVAAVLYIRQKSMVWQHPEATANPTQHLERQNVQYNENREPKGEMHGDEVRSPSR